MALNLTEPSLMTKTVKRFNQSRQNALYSAQDCLLKLALFAISSDVVVRSSSSLCWCLTKKTLKQQSSDLQLSLYTRAQKTDNMCYFNCSTSAGSAAKVCHCKVNIYKLKPMIHFILFQEAQTSLHL